MSDLETAMMECTQLGQVFYSTREEGFDLQAKLAAERAETRFIVKDLWAPPGLYLRSLAEKSRVGLNKSFSEAIRIGFIVCQSHVYTASDGNTLHLSGGATSKDCGESTKSEDISDPMWNAEVTKL